MHYILLVNIVLIDNKLKINELQRERSESTKRSCFYKSIKKTIKKLG